MTNLDSQKLLTDIRACKNEVDEMRRSQTLLEEAAKLSHTGAWEWDLISNRWAFSDEWAEIHGCDKCTLTPGELIEIGHPDDRKAITAAFEDVSNGIGPYDIEHRIIRRNDGEVRTIRARGNFVRDAQGKVIKVYGFAQDITEQKQTEEALRESEAQLRTVLENMTEGAVVATLEGKLIHWNRAALQMHGYASLEECVRLLPEFADTLVLHEIDGTLIPINDWPMARVLRGEQFHNWEVHIARPDQGWEKIFNYGGSIVRDVEGRPLLALLTMADITERKQVEGSLRESEEQFRTMASAMPQLAWMADSNGYIFWYNQRWYEYTGTTPEQMEGWGWQSVHDPDMLPQVLERWKASITTGEPFDMEFPLKGADGIFRWFLTRVFPLKDSEGRVTRWFGTNTDVSERRETEEALREQARMLDLVHVLVRDMDGKIMFWNKGAEMLYGYTREYAVGKTTHELFQTKFPIPLEEIMSKLLKTGDWEGELTHRTRDGREIALASHWVLHRDKDGNPSAIIETNNDITELKQAEEEVRKLNAELEQRVNERTAELQASNRELQSMSYSIMHDLRTPLRAIGGFSDALLKHYSKDIDEKGQDYLRRIIVAAQRMSRIIDDIHDLLRIARAQVRRQEVNMSAMAREILDRLKTSQPEREVEVNIAPGLIVSADPALLREALENLLNNAWKFTSKCEVSRIDIHSVEQNGNRVYVISDNGVGFNPAYADKLFMPFQRLHNESEFPGTGIGLALVERIIRRHGGDIWAESEINQGASFYFTLGEADK